MRPKTRARPTESSDRENETFMHRARARSAGEVDLPRVDGRRRRCRWWWCCCRPDAAWGSTRSKRREAAASPSATHRRQLTLAERDGAATGATHRNPENRRALGRNPTDPTMSAAVALLLATVMGSMAPPTGTENARTPQQCASTHSGFWPAGAPPAHVPSDKSVDGPLLGNGDVGTVVGVSDGMELTFYISKSDFWFLKPMASGPKALGGVRIKIANKSSPVRFELRQDIGKGAVEWNVTQGPLTPPPPPTPQPNRETVNCSILGEWTEHAVTAVLNFTIRRGTSGAGSFIWNNTSPTVAHDGWRYATGSVNEATGAIELDYHRFRAPPGITKFTGHFTGDCSHVTIDRAGTWWRPGESPVAPPLPPTPPPAPTPSPHRRPAPSPATGSVLISGHTTISQTAGISTIVTSIESAAASDLSITVVTFAASGGATGQSADGTTVWTARGIGGCSNATAAIATSVLVNESKTLHSTGSKSGDSTQTVVLTPGVPMWLTHTVVSSLDLGKRLGRCAWDWHDPVPVAMSTATALDATEAKAIVENTEQFWAEYWAKSIISLPTQPDIERYWFSAQYILGSSSRAGRAANGIWGVSNL
eukprot:COSAG02_NODE_3847_length_6152_cov_3.823559_2_plen_593_part_00